MQWNEVGAQILFPSTSNKIKATNQKQSKNKTQQQPNKEIQLHHKILKW